MDKVYILPAVFFAIGGFLLLLALWSRDPKNLGTAVGTLVSSKKVLRRRSKYDDRKYPATACVYTYQVGGKTYRLKDEGFFSRSGLMRKVTVVYLKGLPRFGYLERYPSWQLVVLGALIIAYGAVLLFAI